MQDRKRIWREILLEHVQRTTDITPPIIPLVFHYQSLGEYIAVGLLALLLGMLFLGKLF